MTRRDVLSGIAYVLAFVLLWWGSITLIVVSLHYAGWLWTWLEPR